MAIKIPQQPRIVGSLLNDTKTRYAGGPESPNFLESAGQTFDVGDFIYLDGAGKLAIATNAANVLNGEIAGLADSKATGVTNTKIHFPVLRPDTLLAMNVYHSVQASDALVLTFLSRVCQIKRINNIWRVDVETAEATAEGAAASLARCKIVDFIDKIGDIDARVLVHILPFSIETDGGGLTRVFQLA